MSDDEVEISNGRTVIRGMAAIVADEIVNATGILTIGYMAVNGVTAYEPVAAIASIALGAKYINNLRKGK